MQFEREVAAAWEQAGYAVRGLEGSGDHLVIGEDGLLIHSEAKRQERVRLPEWWAQCTGEAPAGAVPVLTLRWSRGEMLSVVRTADLIRLVSR